MWFASENDGEDLASWQSFTERQHQMIANSFHHLYSARKLIVWKVQHRT